MPIDPGTVLGVTGAVKAAAVAGAKRLGVSRDPLLRIDVREEDGVGPEKEWATWQHLWVTNVGHPHRRGRPDTAENARATVRFGNGQKFQLMWATTEGPKESRDLVFDEPANIPLLIHHIRDRDWAPYGPVLKRGHTYLTDSIFLTQGAPASTVALVPSQRHLFEIAVTYDRSGYASRIFGVTTPSLDDPKRELQWWATSEKSLAKQSEPCHEVLSPVEPASARPVATIGDARGHRFALNTTAPIFTNWLWNNTSERTIIPDDSKGRFSLDRARPSNDGATITAVYIVPVPAENADRVYPVSPAIVFQTLPLASERIEVHSALVLPAAANYYAELLRLIGVTWPESGLRD